MAADEALLELAPCPVLRVYSWEHPCVSFGYFESYQAVRKLCPNTPLIRRWTGGGTVQHGCDLTYSLVVPQCALSKCLAQVRQSYRLLHELVLQVLQQTAAHRAVALQPLAQGSLRQVAESNVCFANPVCNDIIEQATGKKLAGAAQKRTRTGLLHQGSIQNTAWPANFSQYLAELLAAESSTWKPDQAFHQRTGQLVSEKYGPEAWLKRR